MWNRSTSRRTAKPVNRARAKLEVSRVFVKGRGGWEVICVNAKAQKRKGAEAQRNHGFSLTSVSKSATLYSRATRSSLGEETAMEKHRTYTISLVVTAFLAVSPSFSFAQIEGSGTATLPEPEGTPTTESPGGPVTMVDFDLYCQSTVPGAMDAFNMGYDASIRGDFETAKSFYQVAIDLDRNFCDAMDNLGQLLRQEGDLEGAIALYRLSIELNAENPVSRQNLGAALMLSGDNDGAIAAFEEVCRITPDNPEGFYGLGYLYLTMGNYQEAIGNVNTAAELYQEIGSELVTDAYLLLAWAHSSAGNCPEARTFLVEAGPSYATHPAYAEVLEVCP